MVSRYIIIVLGRGWGQGLGAGAGSAGGAGEGEGAGGFFYHSQVGAAKFGIQFKLESMFQNWVPF